MRKLINELTDHFGGVSIAAGDKSKADLAPLPLRGILLVDCDGTLFDVAGQEENTALFDAIITVRQKGYAVVIHSDDPCNNERVDHAFSIRGISPLRMSHKDEDGKALLVWDKQHSRCDLLKRLNPNKTIPIMVIDDKADVLHMWEVFTRKTGYSFLSASPTDIAALKTFANIAEFEVEARHASLEASI
jgi:hypothetical protein